MLSIIVLAAGKGTRMKSDLPKVMHKIAGREMLNLVLDEAKKLLPTNLVVVISDEMKAYQEEISEQHSNLNLTFAIQNERKGTAHAVLCAIDAMKKNAFSNNFLGKKTLILYGDTPLITAKTMEQMLAKLDSSRLCVLAFDEKASNSYGRLVASKNDELQKIVEFKDANESEKKITLCNSGVISCSGENFFSWLKEIKNNNAAHEFYLTDIVAIANQDKSCNLLPSTFIKTNSDELLGVNSREELSKAENSMQQKLRKKAMEEGATMICPESVFLSFDSKIGKDVVIHPNVVLGCGVEISDQVEIKSFCHIEGAKIASGSLIGPFARIRLGCEIGNDCRIGNFVELKKSKLESKVKINHLSYVGDCEIGESSNIGAGTITCNYDGYNKHKTKIGKNVFVGSNSSLVAPVEIKNQAMIGAGSVITKNVEENQLAVARGKQTNIENGAVKVRQKNSKPILHE